MAELSQTAELFGMAVVWIVIAALIARSVPFTSRWGKPLLFAVLIAVPFWELPYGYWNFRSLCLEEARLRVLAKIEPEDSICIERMDSLLYAHLNKVGFSRIEVLSDNSAWGDGSGKIVYLKGASPSSKYCFESRRNVALPWHVSRYDALIVRASDKVTVARQSVIDWAGMWWQRLASPLLGSGGSCYQDPSQPLLAVRRGAT